MIQYSSYTAFCGAVSKSRVEETLSLDICIRWLARRAGQLADDLRVTFERVGSRKTLNLAVSPSALCPSLTYSTRSSPLSHRHEPPINPSLSESDTSSNKDVMSGYYGDSHGQGGYDPSPYGGPPPPPEQYGGAAYDPANPYAHPPPPPSHTQHGPYDGSSPYPPHVTAFFVLLS